MKNIITKKTHTPAISQAVEDLASTLCELAEVKRDHIRASGISLSNLRETAERNNIKLFIYDNGEDEFEVVSYQECCELDKFVWTSDGNVPLDCEQLLPL